MPAAPRRSISPLGELDDSNVLRFLALPAGSDVELDALALVEGLVALAWMLEKWTNTSSPCSREMKPKPFSALKNFTVPVVKRLLFSFKCDGLCDRTRVRP